MIYNKVETDLIKLGNAKKFNPSEEKWITPVYYNGEPLEFTLKNKYVKIEGIEENIYNKDYITIKSKEFSDIIETIVKKLGTTNPLTTDGSFRAVINSKTKSSEEISKLRQANFNACISLSIPTIYSDENKKTVQIYTKDIVVTKILDDNLEIDFDKLQLAM